LAPFKVLHRSKLTSTTTRLYSKTDRNNKHLQAAIEVEISAS